MTLQYETLHEAGRQLVFHSVSGGGLWCVCTTNTDNIKKEGAYSIMPMITLNFVFLILSSPVVQYIFYIPTIGRPLIIFLVSLFMLLLALCGFN